jgi:hypothetical protein
MKAEPEQISESDIKPALSGFFITWQQWFF